MNLISIFKTPSTYVLILPEVLLIVIVITDNLPFAISEDAVYKGFTMNPVVLLSISIPLSLPTQVR